MKTRLRLALQKKGRLAQESLNLLQQCGLKFRLKDNALLTHVDNFPIDLLFVRDDDIPTLIFDGLCDGGIVGENVLFEAELAASNNQYNTILALGNCRCRLSIAVPAGFDYRGSGSLDGKRIATSYPLLLSQYLAKQQICAETLILSGSVEVAPRMGMADAICDLVSSGQTLEDNKLIEVDKVLDSQAVFIQTSKPVEPPFEVLFTMLKRRIQAVQQAMERKYILFHAPKHALERICERLPGAESPTILPLPANPDKVAVHVVSSEGIFWNTLETIQSLGASSILVLPIEKMLE
ncbi:ATP phosphoribosyltransferase [Legionella massiliensis]|uniref:ATP phosphoribosyltransferase n=1 Tax=Legionella massiliensis TaxID=1034943 RepID=A0A078L545_9GAMM|nr:ATP phosphoribosyltransferase [Legionella massiliensis]CDZ79033.1 ATP phosphoribosyltransferase [Legionella massiliensis]CEE14771.1 ATP phosphoribosyltransferase [Legionella massiliensis]